MIKTSKNFISWGVVVSVCFCFLLVNFNFVFSADKDEKIEINFFYSEACPHCVKEKALLNDLEDEHSQLGINRYKVSDRAGIELLEKLYQDYQVSKEKHGYVPITFIADRYFLGFNAEISNNIENYVLEIIENNKEEKKNGMGIVSENVTEATLKKNITLPLIGQIDVARLSPLVLSILLGILDGFNACAIAALGFLLAVLVGTGVRKKVFLVGGVFILVSGVVYFLFISAWLNLFMVLAHIKFITILVGVVIVLFAVFVLKDYFTGVVCRFCQVNPGKESVLAKFQKWLMIKMKDFSTFRMSLPLALLGIVLVAAGINMVELVCSFGFPLIFTKYLTSLNLATSQYYFYLFVYVLFYMIDDFIIFVVAVLTLRITNVSEKYLKIIKLISGILLLILGLIIIFKPDLLVP